VNIKMRNNKLLVKQIKEDLTESEGIIYNSPNQHKSFRGEVVAVDLCSTFKTSDIVYFSEFAGEQISFNAEDYIIIDSENVFAVEDTEETESSAGGCAYECQNN